MNSTQENDSNPNNSGVRFSNLATSWAENALLNKSSTTADNEWFPRIERKKRKDPFFAAFHKPKEETSKRSKTKEKPNVNACTTRSPSLRQMKKVKQQRQSQQYTQEVEGLRTDMKQFKDGICGKINCLQDDIQVLSEQMDAYIMQKAESKSAVNSLSVSINSDLESLKAFFQSTHQQQQEQIDSITFQLDSIYSPAVPIDVLAAWADWPDE